MRTRHAMSRALVVSVLVLTACMGGGDQVGSERLITFHPRLVSSYVLTTIQQAIVDNEPLREYICDPAKNQVLMCQRAERVRQHLQFAQTQLTRILGDAPERDQPPINPQSLPLPK